MRLPIDATKGRTKSMRIGLAVLGLALSMALGSVASASADFQIVNYRGGPFEADNATESVTAGVHPNKATFELEMDHLVEGSKVHTVEDMKTVVVDLPPGMLGDTTSVPTCPRDRLLVSLCPVASQVGTITLKAAAFGFDTMATMGVYNMVPRRGEIADFGFVVSSVPVHIVSTLRDGDYGVRTTLEEISEAIPVYASKLVLWGVPGLSQHDPFRTPGSVCNLDVDAPGCVAADGGNKAGVTSQALMSNPTSCNGPLTTTVKVESWTNPGVWKTAQSTTATPVVGCDSLSFAPNVDVDVANASIDSASGFGIGITMPADRSPSGKTPAHLKKVVAAFPQGVHINPALTNGLVACGDGELGLGTHSGIDAGENGCPFGSKIGTATVTSPALSEALTGGLYVRPQASSDPASGQMFRLVLILKNVERGIIIKIPAEVKVNPQTGRLETVFDNNPQLPVSSIDLRMNGGSRAPLVTPPTCGNYAVDFTFSSWGGQVVRKSAPFAVSQNCGLASQFAPGFEAGSADPSAGKSTAFSLRISRSDGYQNLGGLTVNMPEGLLAKLAGVELCPEALAGAGQCPTGSQVGTSVIASGSGSDPVYVPQPGKTPTAVYLAGPYKGAPYSLVVKVPAQSGPFDLGTVAVRNAIEIDPVTTAVTVTSDPLPQIVSGVPISYRDLRVNIDRDGFMRNPTDCGPATVGGRLSSAGGLSVAASDRFQVSGCDRLGFKPKLALGFTGKTHRSAFPALKATLTMPKSGANVSKAVVLMPKTELLEQSHIRTLCTRDQWAQDSCPKASIYGRAKAWTPLLDKPLEGNVYLRSNGGARELPDLVADLKGQIDIELVGYIDAVNARLRARFLNVPDAPVTKFTLEMQGGKKGLLAHNTDVCKTRPVASAKFSGQNGKVHDINPVVKVACGKKK